MIRGITFASQRTFSADFAHFQNVLLGASGITKGCAITENSGEITVSEGYFFVCGREVAIVDSEPIIVPDRLGTDLFCTVVFEINLSKSNTLTSFNQGYFKTLTSEEAYLEPTQQDLDAGGTLYQMPFATYRLTATGVADFVDTRPLLSTQVAWKKMNETATKLMQMTGRLVNGQQLTDVVTGEVYTIGINNGALYITDSQQHTISFQIQEDSTNTTTFNDDGSITTAYADGRSKTTVFNADGSITTTSYYNGVASKVEKTTFNADGSITTTFTEGSNA